MSSRELQDFFESSNVEDIDTIKHIRENERNFNTSLKYYYENEQDRKDIEKGGLNLSNKHRPWFSFVKQIGNKSIDVSGRSAFNDPVLYKPVLMNKYINKYFIEPFEINKRICPFKFSAKNRNTSEIYQLEPHQKFCGQFISNQTDFPGLLLYHGLGSGKTVTAIVIAESVKSKFIDDRGKIQEIEGREVTITKGRKVYCPVTILVPKDTIEQYKNEIIGQIQDGVIKSATSSCIIYSEDTQEEYKQVYVGSIDPTSSKFVCREIEKMKKIDLKLKELGDLLESEMTLYHEIGDLIKNNKGSKELHDKISELQQKITKLRKDITKLNKDKRKLSNDLNNKIQHVYFIVSFDTFINKLIKKNELKKKSYEASDYVINSVHDKNLMAESKKGDTYIGKLAHPDCFHSEKSLIIIDEVHKNSGENAMMYNALYNTLNIYCRNLINGEHTMKVVLLTATPVFDIPFQMAQAVNLMRPRIPFPRDQQEHDNLFIDKFKNEIKNKMLYKYLLSGYISYFKGGDPSAYPFRRNNIKLHVMSRFQYQTYKNYLIQELKTIKQDTSSERQHGFTSFDIDENDKKKPSGQFAKVIGSMLCVFDDDENTSISTENKSLSFGKELLELGKFSNNDVREKFSTHSAKLSWISDEIEKSCMNGEGPIYVHTGLVSRGIIPLVFYLMSIGFTFLNDYELGKTNIKKGSKTFGVWSPGAFDVLQKNGFFKGSISYSDYKSLLHSKINHPMNHDGSICKVVIGNIQEGISFLNVSKIFLVLPWWNDARNEQVIGRGIRFFSHGQLPQNRQYIDIYYNCNIFSNFPERKKQLHEEFINERIGTTWAGLDLSVCTFDQCMYTVSKNKHKLNVQFEIAAKESSIDYELNKEGNVSRLEEFVFKDIVNTKNEKVKEKIKNLYEELQEKKIFYNRSIDQYYLFDESNKKLSSVKMIYKYSKEESSGEESDGEESDGEESDGEGEIREKEEKIMSIWPFHKFENPVNLHDFKLRDLGNDINGKKMTSIIIDENIKSDLSNSATNDKNFTQLMEYAINNGEEKSAWDEINNLRLTNDAINIMVPLFKLQSSTDGISEIRKLAISVKDDKIWYSNKKLLSVKNEKIELVALLMSKIDKDKIIQRIKDTSERISKKITENDEKLLTSADDNDIKIFLTKFTGYELDNIYNSLKKKKKR
jgi:hypothetical protein